MLVFPRRPRRLALQALIAGACLTAAWARPAAARLGGIASPGCNGCHSGGALPQVTVTASTNTPAPGQVITISVTVTETNGPVAGFYLQSTGKGQLKAIEAGTTATAYGANHTTPRRGSGGPITFNVQWTAPAEPGGVVFYGYALSANDNRATSGDAGGDAFLALAYGCAGTTYYPDQDGDGYGSADLGYVRDCAQPAGYSARQDDCDDFRKTVHPDAEEICDGLDNDCDGQKDEGVAVGMLCEDRDGDGHGSRTGATHVGCQSTPGFAPCDGDCDDNDPGVHPGAAEICNERDDNCDLRIDEGVRPTCGEGWCRRNADSCGAGATCTPGTPRAEQCNAFDDDCDGAIDNGDDAVLCGGPGLACVRGDCIAAPGAGGGGAQPDGGGGSGGGGGKSGCTVGAQDGSGGWGAAAIAAALLLLAARSRRH
jgi:hypothetical protein